MATPAQTVSQTTEPQPSTSAQQPNQGAKRKRPETTQGATTTKKTKTNEPTTDHTEQTTTHWYDIGETYERDGRTYRLVKAETAPGQKRIQGRMSDAEKLKIAEDNETLRENYKRDLQPYQIYIQYIGKNTPLGIPGQGYYDKNNDEHRLAVMSVGGTLSAAAKALQEKIKRDKEKLTNPANFEDTPEEATTTATPTTTTTTTTNTATSSGQSYRPASKLTVYHKGYRFVYYLWKYTKARDEVIGYPHGGVMNQPEWNEMTITSSSDAELWQQIWKACPNIDKSEATTLYNNILLQYINRHDFK